jgi:hypothetical protein
MSMKRRLIEEGKNEEKLTGVGRVKNQGRGVSDSVTEPAPAFRFADGMAQAQAPIQDKRGGLRVVEEE